jgi:hypothetical protein
MKTVLFWPNGDWAYEDEVWKPEPDFQRLNVSPYWTDARIDEIVQHRLTAPSPGSIAAPKPDPTAPRPKTKPRPKKNTKPA